jgi:uncharacterized protein (DUF111 family)
MAGQRIIYFDPFAGAAGDMINAALIDAGANLEVIQAAIASLEIAGLGVHIEPVMKGPIGALRFIVDVDHAVIPHHLDANNLLELAERAAVTPAVRSHVISIINRLVDAESHVHRVSKDQVHFHELGGLDTIVDVLGASVALDSLGVEQCYTGPLPTGRGSWNSEHGQLPLPMPATLEIIAQSNLAVTSTPSQIPSGKEFPVQPVMHLECIGYGAGTRDLPIPNILRAWVGTSG